MASKRQATSKDKRSNTMRPSRLYKPMARSRVTNGVSILPNVDGRTLWVRRYRDINALLLSDRGGDEAASEAEKMLIRKAACIAVELERRETQFAEAGEASDNQIEVYQRSANSLRRLLESIGLKRSAKTIGPSLVTCCATASSNDNSKRQQERNKTIMLIDDLLSDPILRKAGYLTGDLRGRLSKATKFVQRQDFALAADEFSSNIDNVNKVLPLARLPFPEMWLEVSQHDRRLFAQAPLDAGDAALSRVGYLLTQVNQQGAWSAQMFWSFAPDQMLLGQHLPPSTSGQIVVVDPRRGFAHKDYVAGLPP